jgi:Big-like domain-containing protein
MSYIFATVRQIARRWGWLVVCPVLAVCGGANTSGPLVAGHPGTISDLAVAATTEVSVTLSFTQVDDGMGQPAKYDVRYAVAPISWSSAASVVNGTCATPLTGTGVGGTISCTIVALSPSTSYNVQAMAFRGTLNGNAVFGGSSNVAAASTVALPPPPPVVTTVTVSPASVSVAVGANSALEATVKDQNGSVMTGQTVTWSSNNTVAATVSSSGVVTGVAAGSATITGTSSGKTGTSAITVTAGPPPPPVVTTVTVAPASASIVASATVSLQATVKDQNGTVMTGQTVSWSTNNAAAATVNSSGVVTGVAGGSATITATSSGKTGTSSITVTAAPPPPPGGTILFQENFEDANLASRGWYDNTSVLLSTAEHIAGSTSSAQYHFLPGATSPTSGGSQRHKFPTPSNSFYVSFYVKYSANWVGSGVAYHPHEFYTLSTLDGDYDGPSQNYLDVYVEHNYLNGGRPRFEFQDNKSVNYSYGPVPNNLITTTEDRSTGGCNGVVESNIYSECFNFGTYWYNDKQLTGPVVFQPNPGPGYKNDWNFVEAYFQLNTIVNGIGQADGVAQYWFNGTLIIDRHDILFRTGAHPTIQFNQFIIAPYIGVGSPADQSMFIDNLRVATGRIP